MSSDHLFWDTKLEKINWKRQKNAVIKRVFDLISGSGKVDSEFRPKCYLR